MNYSVAIVNFNGREYIEKCLNSFLKQTPPPKEVVVIDNCSSDDSVKIVKEQFPAVRTIENKKNWGYGYSLNQGISGADTELIVLANQDLYVCDDWIEHVLLEFNHFPDCGLVASKVLYMDEPKRINSTGMLFYKDFSAVNRGLDEFDKGQFDKSEEVFGAYGAVMAFKRKVFNKTGLFDEDYFLFKEEDELMWRMRRAGWITKFAPNARAYHKRSAAAQLFSPLKLYYSERNRFWNVIKHMPLRCNLTMLPYVIYRYWANLTLAYKSKKGQKGQKLSESSKGFLMWTIAKAWLAALIGLPKMFLKRIRIRNGSVLSYSDCLKLMRKYKADLADIVK